MIENIVIVAGLTGMLDALFEKWGVFDWLAKVGSKSDSELIYQGSQCRFCLRFWISVIITAGILPFATFSWAILIVPFVVGGLIHLIQENDV